MPGSDPELTVFPQTGEMLPQGTEGTKISVAFTPKMYGRAYKGKLVIQVSRLVTPQSPLPTTLYIPILHVDS